MIINECMQEKKVRVNRYLHYEPSPFDTMLHINKGSTKW